MCGVDPLAEGPQCSHRWWFCTGSFSSGPSYVIEENSGPDVKEHLSSDRVGHHLSLQK